MAYATPENMLLRYDSRRLGQLVLDDGTKATEQELATDPVLAELLEDATSMINSSLLRGDRYSVEDLEALDSETDAKLLIRLTCDLTYGLLVQRRGFTAEEQKNLAPAYAGALAILDRLANGEAVFNIEANRLAGKPKRAVIDRRRALITSTRRIYGDLTIIPNNPGDPPLFGNE